MSEDKLHTAIHAGHEAKRLLDDPILIKVFQSLEEQFIWEWKTRPVLDTAGRERLWQAVNVVGLVQGMMKALVTNGHLARRDLDELINGKLKDVA